MEHFDPPNMTPARRMELLKDIAEALNETNHIDEAMEAILPLLGEVLGLSTAWAFRFDPKRNSFVEVGASGLPPALACGGAAPLKSGWCECQDQFVQGRLNKAVNLVTCSRLRDAVGDKQGLVCHASIPLRSKDKPLGILNVAASGSAVFTAEALSLLGTIGHQVAVAVDRAGIIAEERRRAHKLQALSAMSARLVSVVNPSTLLQFAVDAFVEDLQYEACGVTIPTTGEGAKSEHLLIAVAHRQQTVVTNEYTYDDEESAPLLPESHRVLLPDAKSALVRDIPHTEYQLRIESRLKNAFSEVDEDVLSAFALHLSAAIENAKLYQQSLESAKWTERRKLAADLHDSVSQRLFSALLIAKSAGLMVRQGGNAEQTAEHLDKLQGLIAQSQEEMRALIQTLRPVSDRGFMASLRDRIEPLQLQASTRIHWTVDSEVEKRLTLPKREALLGVIDEALQNVMKHAGARHAYINVALSENSVIATIQDDGCGFDDGTCQKGLGTSTMYERVHAVGGQLHIRSEVGNGTTVVCEIPVSQSLQ
jgi:signal transduction histidine kinase